MGALGASMIFAFVIFMPDRATYVTMTVAILTMLGLRGNVLSLLGAHREFEAFENAVDEALVAEAAGNSPQSGIPG